MSVDALLAKASRQDWFYGLNSQILIKSRLIGFMIDMNRINFSRGDESLFLG